MTLPVTSQHVVAIDLGGSNVRAVLCDALGEPRREARAATAKADGAALVEQLTELTRALAAGAGVAWEQVAGVAVGVPGVVAHDGQLRMAPNLPPLHDGDFAGRLGARLGVPIAVDNDVNMATLAEHRQGIGAGLSDFVFIAVGTGVGMGLVTSGQLQRGATGAAGEIGYLPVGADPFDAEHHARGSLEEVAGGAAIARRYAALARLDGARPSAREVFDRARAGDRPALAVLDEQARAIALAVFSAVAIVDPAVVAFGGGIGSREDFVDHVRGYVARLTPRPLAMRVSPLGERAGIIGAAELARERAAALPADRTREAAVHD